jgi:hypothetical protein
MNIMGIDPGPRRTGVAVYGTHGVIEVSVWELEEDFCRACADFRARIEKCMLRLDVGMLAVEDTILEGKYFVPNVKVFGMGCVARSLCASVLVQFYTPKEWMSAIVGQAPQVSGFGWTSALWKRTVRGAIGLRLKEMGIDGERLLGEDEGNHKADALGVALYAGDRLHIQQYVRH